MNGIEQVTSAIDNGVVDPTLILGLNWVWWVILIGVPIFGMILYRYVIQSVADRLLLFLSNKAWTDQGKLVEFKGERWVIEKIGLFRVLLVKSSLIENRGVKERMKKTLTIRTTKYIDSDIIFYEYQDLYRETDPDKEK